MASRDGSRTRGRGRRQTRSGRASASDEDDFAEQTPTVKRTTRRTSIITVEPQGQPENGLENVSIPEVQREQVQGAVSSHSLAAQHDQRVAQQEAGEHDGGRSQPPATSERLRATAGRVGGQIQDTLSSAMDKAGLSWRTLGSLLLLAVLTSWLTSRLAQQDPTKQNIAGLRSSMEQADKRYSSLMKKLQDAEERLDSTEGKLHSFDRTFSQGSSDEDTVLSKKADPNMILNLAEQRVQSLLDTYSADKTGLVDYALAPAGGKVVGHSLLFPRPDDPAITTWNQIGAALIPGAMPAVHPLADKFVLTPGGPVPGECLPLNGTKGEVIIHLREPIIPTAVTYEHVPSAITYDFRSAPMDITVVGWLSEGYRFTRKKGSLLPVLEHRRPVPPKQIGSFTYSFSKTNLQTVAVDSNVVVDHVRFQVNSNYGRPDYTCIYRVRVHGIAPGYAEEIMTEEVSSPFGSATSGSF